MPKVNRSLVTSIIEDMKELITVANEMCSWIGKVEHLSWRFPSRAARNINAIAIVQQHKGSAGEMYILILEMAYDRVHFILRLVLEFLDGYPFIEEFFNEVAETKRPRTMSLASIIQVLWQRLKLIPETVTRNMIKTKHLENSVAYTRKSRGCQASGSLSFCESCSKADKTMIDFSKTLSTALQSMKLSSVSVAQREIIRSNIFDKTQWAVMTKFVEAINVDTQTLFETTAAIRTESETRVNEYKKSVHMLETELEKQRIERSSLDLEIRELIAQMQAVENRWQGLNIIYQESVEKNRTLTDDLQKAKEKSFNLEILLAFAVQQVNETSESKVALETTVENLKRRIIKETKELSKSLEQLRDEKILLEKQYLDEVQNLKEKHANIVENSNEDDLVSNGDPEFDMAQQFVKNEKTIERLTRQNERLSKTLTRLKEHRKVSRARNIEGITDKAKEC